jgi:Holliday junction resolvase-like predicted endonuclease
MLTENDVVQAVADYLRVQGYRIDKQLSTTQRGIDIEATHPQTGRVMLVEAKGGTSSKKGTRRYGSVFTRNQARSHVSVALYAAARMYESVADSNIDIALAFPDDVNHRDLLKAISRSLRALGITVFLVEAGLEVNTLDPSTQKIAPPDAAPRRE